MEYVLLTGMLLIVVLLLVLLVLQLAGRRRSHSLPLLEEMKAQLEAVKVQNDRMEVVLRGSLQAQREELTAVTRENRQELAQTLGQQHQQNLQFFRDMERQLKNTLTNALMDFSAAFRENMASFKELQQLKFTHMTEKQTELILATEQKLETIRHTVEEKLEKTLSERLGQSFETVGKQLIEVQKGLGEMQVLAADVGGLKKVLSQVKLRGGAGEVQLGLLLEQILAPVQYEANVIIKRNTRESVEYAIKLPGRGEEEGAFVYLPIDAKFPKDAYEHLMQAYENGSPEEAETASKNLEATIRKMARDISEKYIDPPTTTDFALLFLPFESIYAEVIRRTALVDQLRDRYKVIVAGPTTLMALLNSLQMGFRTLALQKRSSQVWEVLAAVKKDFADFGGLLEKAQKNIHTGLGQLDDVMGKRTRAIQRRLKAVETLEPESSKLDAGDSLPPGITGEKK